MALADYALCHLCQGKAFYDANISDPKYCATWDPSEECDPIGIAVLCAECNKSHEAIIRPRREHPECPDCNDTGLRDTGGTQPWGDPVIVPCDCAAAIRKGDQA